MENEETIKQVELLGQSITEAIFAGYNCLAPRIEGLESAAQHQARVAANSAELTEQLVSSFAKLESRVTALEELALSQKQTIDLLAQCVHLHGEVFAKLGGLAAQENGGPFIVRS